MPLDYINPPGAGGGGSPDNLGNHTATTEILMGGKGLRNLADVSRLGSLSLTDGDRIFVGGNRGGEFLYHDSGRSGLGYTLEGIYFDAAGADDYFERSDVPHVDPAMYGAVGDGIANDGGIIEVATKHALANGLELFLRDNRTYLCDTWTPFTADGVVAIRGTGTLLGPDTSTIFCTIGDGSSLRIVDATFERWGNIFTVPSSGSIESIELVRAKFENYNHAIAYNSTNTNTLGKAVVSHSRFSTAVQAGLRLMPLNLTGHVSIDHSVISGVTGTATNGPKGISIGNDSHTSYGPITIDHCIVEDIVGTDEDTLGIRVVGDRCSVSNTHISNVNSTSSTDVEGLYTKCTHARISFCELVDAGTEEGCINIKGAPIGENPAGDVSVLIGNQIRRTTRPVDLCTGIRIRRSDVLCIGNRIEGTQRGIWVGSGDDTKTISNVHLLKNQVLGLRPQDGQSREVSAIRVDGPFQDIAVEKNPISDIGAAGNNANVVGLMVYVRNQVLADKIRLLGNTIDGVDANSASQERSILFDLPATESISNVDICGNRVTSAGVGLRMNNVGGYSHVNVWDNDFVGATTPHILSGTPDRTWTYRSTLQADAADGDTSPTVAGVGTLYVSNTSAITISDCDDGFPGQEVLVFVSDSNTTINASSTLTLGSAGNYAPGTGIAIRIKTFDGVNWFETGRTEF